MLKGLIFQEVFSCIQVYSSRLVFRVVELYEVDHVHLLVKVQPKVSISQLMGMVKGKSALRLFTRFPYLKQKPYRGKHFWVKGYCVDTVGVDADMILKYVKYQEKQEQLQMNPMIQFWGSSTSLLRGLAFSPLIGGIRQFQVLRTRIFT